MSLSVPPDASPEEFEFATLIGDIVRRQAQAVNDLIEDACWRALSLGVGVLVLTRHGVPWKCGPHPSVPAGEIHQREGDEP